MIQELTSGHKYKELQAESLRDICTPEFIATLFTTANRWKQSTCSSTNEWIKKM